jgi:hypothetical protein
VTDQGEGGLLVRLLGFLLCIEEPTRLFGFLGGA